MDTGLDPRWITPAPTKEEAVELLDLAVMAAIKAVSAMRLAEMGADCAVAAYHTRGLQNLRDAVKNG